MARRLEGFWGDSGEASEALRLGDIRAVTGVCKKLGFCIGKRDIHAFRGAGCNDLSLAVIS